jgi:hypothetical protein
MYCDPTKESVLADEGLKLIGSVRELSRVRRFSPGYVFVQNPSQDAQCPDCALQDPTQQQPPTQPPSLSQPIAPMPADASPAVSAPQGSLSARANKPVTPGSSALEPELPALSPAQEGPEKEARRVSGAAMPTHPGGMEAATWDAIEISFTSEERVQIRNGATTETRNYTDFGFEDSRSGKPNRAWEALRVLAAEGGTIRDSAKISQTWPNIEKRIQEVRKVLRKNFGISADPIPFVAGIGYQARFKIGCRPSFRT